MPRKSSIAPRACKVLWEGNTPADENAVQPFALPASFPSHCLTDDQLNEVETWFDEWAASSLHALRQALVLAHTRSTKGAAPTVSLQQFLVHAAVISHLLRLHPCTECSLQNLAKALGVSRSRVNYARDAILANLGADAVAAFRSVRKVHNVTMEQIADIKELDFPAAQRVADRVLLIPFAGHCWLHVRFAVVQQIASFPGVASVREDITNENRNAVRITLKA